MINFINVSQVEIVLLPRSPHIAGLLGFEEPLIRVVAGLIDEVKLYVFRIVPYVGHPVLKLGRSHGIFIHFIFLVIITRGFGVLGFWGFGGCKGGKQGQGGEGR